MTDIEYIESLEKEIAELRGRITDLCKPRLYDGYSLQKENAELKKRNGILENDLRVARKDREDLQLAVGEDVKKFIHDCPYSALEYLANSELTKENEELKSELSDIKTAIRNYSKAETYQQQEITWNSLLEFIN